MDLQSITLKAERLAELEEYAKTHGQTPADALGDVLAIHFALEREDHEETVAALLKGMKT